MGKMSAWQIILLVVIVLVVFGSARLPQVAESIGKSLKVFKREVKELREEDEPTGHPHQPGELQASPEVDLPSQQAHPQAHPGPSQPETPDSGTPHRPL